MLAAHPVLFILGEFQSFRRYVAGRPPGHNLLGPKWQTTVVPVYLPSRAWTDCYLGK